jgi:hypothetical protein
LALELKDEHSSRNDGSGPHDSGETEMVIEQSAGD